MKTQKRLSLMIITIFINFLILLVNFSIVFGQVKVDVADVNEEINRSIFLMENGSQIPTLIVGTDKGNVYSYEVNKIGLPSILNSKRFDFRPQTNSTIRAINFNSSYDGYILKSDGIYSLQANSDNWQKISGVTNFPRVIGTSPVLWSMNFANNNRVCIVGVYFKGADTIEKELLLCTDNINKPNWLPAKPIVNRKKNDVQLTDIYFNKNSEAWVIGTDGLEGIVWYSDDNGVNWKEEETSLAEPLLSISGTRDKLFAVGFNGLVVRKDININAREKRYSLGNKTVFKKGDKVKINAKKVSGNLGLNLEIIGVVNEINNDLLSIKVDSILPNNELFNRFFSFFEKVYFNQDDVENYDNKADYDNSSSVKWTPVLVPTKSVNSTRQRLNSVKFAKDEKHGFIAGNNGTILYTINGGETWDTLHKDDLKGVNLYSISIDDSNKRCFIAGSEGKIVIISYGR